jgi:RNA polymerase sigma factor (sigma-70 family)
MAEGTGPQKPEDVIREFFQSHYTKLLRHAGHHIRHDELAGDIPKGALDARDIVDEVARQAEAKAGAKPRQMKWLVWIYHLMHQELSRQRRALKQKMIEEVSLEERKKLPEDSEKAAGYDAEKPLDIIEEELEPSVVQRRDLVPDTRIEPPDEILARKDALEQLQRDMRNWPRPEREVYELYFVEGLEPEEIAMVTRQPLKKVQENIAFIQQRLREEMLQEETAAA